MKIRQQVLDLPQREIGLLLSALRGPDSDSVLTPYIKAITALYVRVAVYGLARTRQTSTPEEPMTLEKFKGYGFLQDKIEQLVGGHYLGHALCALEVIRDRKLVAKKYLKEVVDVIKFLEDLPC